MYSLMISISISVDIDIYITNFTGIHSIDTVLTMVNKINKILSLIVLNIELNECYVVCGYLYYEWAWVVLCPFEVCIYSSL